MIYNREDTMKLIITEKAKKDKFISIFHLLKNCSSIIRIIFTEDDMYIQGMDKSHICLFDVKIVPAWFDTYIKDKEDASTISIDTHILHNVLSMTQEQHSLTIHYEGEPENISIDLCNTSTNPNTKNDFNKYFKLPLSDLDADILAVPEIDYEAEFSINAKKINEIMGQLLQFGDSMNITCSEEKISLMTTGENGEMLVNIPVDDLSEYAISEGEIIELSYSLTYVQKMCITHKLSSEIDFAISANYPMKIKYDLGESSHVIFYIAPKIKEE
jgi:proliferating cell nuclear antigen